MQYKYKTVKALSLVLLFLGFTSAAFADEAPQALRASITQCTTDSSCSHADVVVARRQELNTYGVSFSIPYNDIRVPIAETEAGTHVIYVSTGLGSSTKPSVGLEVGVSW